MILGTPTVALCLSNLTAADTRFGWTTFWKTCMKKQATGAGAFPTVRVSNLSAAQAARPVQLLVTSLLNLGRFCAKCCAALNGRLFAGNQVRLLLLIRLYT